jgi:predicted O-methyltransferase YrrM
MNKTICLVAICKDEENCILDMLNSVYKFINYWIISDTGSSDKTCEIIEDFFREKKIPGELFHDKWVNMGFNKTQALERAYGLCDYILHLDADDVCVGKLDMRIFDTNKDCYYFQAERGEITYKASLFFNGKHRWKICGAAHTILRNLDKDEFSIDMIDNNDFYLLSRDIGNRSTDVNKYLKDAELLKNQFFETLIDDEDNLNTRSVFYAAQSYMDCGKFSDALMWYNLFKKLKNTWLEELYESHIRSAKCMMMLKYDIKKIETEIKSAISLEPERAEPYFSFGKYLNDNKKCDLAYKYLKEAKSKNLNEVKSKYILFINEKQYGKWINDEFSVACFWTQRYQEGLNLLNEIIDDSSFTEHKDRLEQNKMYFLSKMNTFSRTDIINYIIEKINAERYLEIGVENGNNFESVFCKYKLGVDPDPSSKALLIQTSNYFFAHNKVKFDVIFIDGLHIKEQVLLDISNSLDSLNDGGVIVCHDINPEHEWLQRRERTNEQIEWTGDCWRAFVELRKTRRDLEMFVVDTDYGCGIIKRGTQQTIDYPSDIDYEYFDKHRKRLLNLKSVDEFKMMFQKNSTQVR